MNIQNNDYNGKKWEYDQEVKIKINQEFPENSSDSEE